MRRRPNAPSFVGEAVALLAVVALCVAAATLAATALQGQLESAAEQAIVAEKADWAIVAIEGQNLSVAGTAPDVVARQSLYNALVGLECSAFGFRVPCGAAVQNAVTLRPPAAPPHTYEWLFTRKANGIELQAQVPSSDAGDWLLKESTRRLGPGATLQVSAVEGQPFAALETVWDAGLQAISLLRAGRVAMDSTALKVDGSVADAEAEQRLHAALTEVKPPFSVGRVSLVRQDELDRCNVKLAGLLSETPIAFVLFRSELKRRSQSVLGEIANVVRGCPGRLRVEGHTDNVGEPEDNRRLSFERAWVVSRSLIEVGLDSTRIYSVGLGETRPIASNHTRNGRTLNRRIELRLEGFFDEPPIAPAPGNEAKPELEQKAADASAAHQKSARAEREDAASEETSAQKSKREKRRNDPAAEGAESKLEPSSAKRTESEPKKLGQPREEQK